MSTRADRLILASAGTGKTYQLTGQFLRLLVDGVAPERILATTFTRKAAGEILDRVLRRLAEAATDEGVRRDLNAQLERDLGADDYRGVLATLVRSLDRVRIRTLDAFFVHVAKLFALDLELPSDWTIVEEVEDDGMRRDAIARALEGADKNEVIELLRGLQKRDASRSIERSLLGTVRKGRDAFLDSPPRAWSRVKAPAAPSDEEFAQARAGLEALEVPKTASGSPSKSWEKAKRQALERVAQENWEPFIEKGIANKILAGETSYDRRPISDDVVAAFRPLIDTAVHHLLRKLAEQNEATYHWLERFEEGYREIKLDRRAFRFEDLPQALAPAGADPLLERQLDMWYRIDGQIDHLLLDEFQDTAPVQWRILRRLAEELLAIPSDERTFFCVGDVKQSIYGWREAEPRLLAEMSDRYPQLQPEKLTSSYRSSRIVLETVDRVFATVGESAALEGTANREAGEEWQRTFEHHEAAKDLPGAVFLVGAPHVEEEDTHLSPLRVAADRAAEIAREAPQATIGILLRRNKNIARLIYELRQRGVRASGEGGNQLTDSAAVLHLLSLLHLADHPGDRAAAFHVATSPLAEAAGLAPGDERDHVQIRARAARTRLADEGYGAFCGSLRALVHERYAAWDATRFDQLVDIAHGFDERAGIRPGAFVEYVRKTVVEDPSTTQVKVMTIHAAKGLEFDAVVLPELDELFQREAELYTDRPDPTDLIQGVSNARKRAICDLDPERLAPLRHQQVRRGMREALCILYVAMTRAARRLDMIVQTTKSGKLGKSYAGILRETLAEGRGGDGVLWSHAENAQEWFVSDAPLEPETSAPAPAADAPLFKVSSGLRSLPRKAPSAQEGGGHVRGATLVRSTRSEARTRGTLVHRWMEEVEWLEDFGGTDAELLDLAAPIEPDFDARQALLADFRTTLERPATRALLTRAEQASREGLELEVWRERRFSVLLPGSGGDEELWSGSFDRVVLRREGGELTGADLLDFKTDRVAEGGLAERADFYRPQLEAYRRVLARMTGLAEEQISLRLLFVAEDALVELT